MLCHATFDFFRGRTMLTVNTYLAPSPVHGIGLFAAEFIPAGSRVWKFHRHIDKIFKREVFLAVCSKLDNRSLRHLLNSSYSRGGRYFYLTDNARFINHSDMHDNISFIDDYTEVAVRDIDAHEELLENYLLAYDKTDFFFQELLDPDPYQYINSLQLGGLSHA
jgi:SET domain-containing protein